MSLLRPQIHLNRYSARYPNAWSLSLDWRQDRGKDLPNWPDWCFFPMSGWYAAICDHHRIQQLNPGLASEVSKLSCLGAWRYTQSIYKLDPTIQDALTKTTPIGNIPVELILQMPEWCVYVETPGLQYCLQPLFGFFAFLEWDANTERPELRLEMDTVDIEGNDQLLSTVLHIGNWSIEECVERAKRESIKQAKIAGGLFEEDFLPDNWVEMQTTELLPILSLLLYVCSNGVDYPNSDRPSYPDEKKTKKRGWTPFPATKPRIWNLGKKTGDAIRQAFESKGSTTSPSPHIRRAHWHTFLSGPRSEPQKRVVKWIPPLPVAMPD